jgi:nucleotide-binding universal stress UspA family protein
MYRRILLASDGSLESLVALREGALMAHALRAAAYLLIVRPEGTGVMMAEVFPVLHQDDPARELLARGLERLKRLGLAADGVIAAGEPTQVIAACARSFAADLVVVGHRRQSLLDRWWSGKAGAYIIDHVGCSVLVARDVISDDEFEAKFVEYEAKVASVTA